MSRLQVLRLKCVSTFMSNVYAPMRCAGFLYCIKRKRFGISRPVDGYYVINIRKDRAYEKLN